MDGAEKEDIRRKANLKANAVRHRRLDILDSIIRLGGVKGYVI